jgi:MarR family transcriptional regulator, transcriptional regulator for hemolysin
MCSLTIPFPAVSTCAQPDKLMEREEAFAQTLSRVSRGWRAVLDARLRDTRFTQARWYVLLHLSRAEAGLTQRELADRVGVEGPTIGRLLDALELQGIIERRPVDGDRRANHIHLTAAAQPLLEEIERTASGLRKELLEGIAPRDIDTCVSVLQTIGERLERR